MVKFELSRRYAVAFMAVLGGPWWAGAGAAAEEATKPKAAFISLGDFTVNLPDDGSSAGYVVIGITLDVTPESAKELNEISPRLKDLVMRRLMAMASQGMLASGHTDMALIKTSLFDGVAKLHPDAVREVLITRLLYG